MKLLFSLPVVNSQTYSNLLKPLVLALLCSYSTCNQAKLSSKINGKKKSAFCFLVSSFIFLLFNICFAVVLFPEFGLHDIFNLHHFRYYFNIFPLWTIIFPLHFFCPTLLKYWKKKIKNLLILSNAGGFLWNKPENCTLGEIATNKSKSPFQTCNSLKGDNIFWRQFHWQFW